MADIVSEDTFTPAAAWCPSPGYWHCEDNGQSTEVEVTELVAAFVRALQPEVAVEISGAHTGQTTYAIGTALQRNGHGALYSVELDPRLAEGARQRCEGLPVHVVTGSAFSWDVPDGIGFAWIDGSEGRAEAEHLRGKLLPGAIIGVHDTAPHHSWNNPTALAIGRFARPITLRTPRGVTFAEVL